jgi:hypothetical protein
MTLHYASIDEAPAIFAVFQHYADLFPHIIRHPKYIDEQVTEGNVIWEGGVVLIEHQVQRNYRLADQHITKGDIKLCQIAALIQGQPQTHILFQQWLQHWAARKIWLSVLANNDRAKHFYTKYGFKSVDTTAWGDHAGEIWCKQPSTTVDILSF